MLPPPQQLRIVILIVPMILLIIGIKRPIFAVIGYMILVYCKTSTYYPVIAQIHGELVFAFLILLRLAFQDNAYNKLSPKYDAINKYIILLVISVTISFAISWDHQYSWDFAIYHFIKTLILYVMIVAAIETKKDLRLYVFGFVIMFLYLAYEPTYGFLFGTGGSVQIYGTNYASEVGILAGHVALANNMNQMIPIVWYLFFSSNNKYNKFLTGTAMVCFLIALIGSGSRGGIVGLATITLCIIYFSKKRIKAAIIGGLVVIVFAITIGTSAVNTASRIDSHSTMGRLTGLTHGIGMLLKGNVLGVGPGCYLIARSRYFHYRMESHNIYGQVMGDLGIPGMIVCFLLVRELFRGLNFVKHKSGMNPKGKGFEFYLMLGVQVSLITRLVVSMGSHGLYYFYWYVMAALIVSSRNIVNDSYKKTNGIVNALPGNK